MKDLKKKQYILKLQSKMKQVIKMINKMLKNMNMFIKNYSEMSSQGSN